MSEQEQQRGFTLIELMVSLVLFSIAVAGILSVAVSMTVGIRSQRQVVAAEVAARAPIDFLADAVRGASPGASNGDIKDIETCASGAIIVTDSSIGPDQLELVYASGGIVTYLSTAYASTTSTTMNVMDGTQLAAGDYVLVVDNVFQTGHLAHVTAVNGNTLTIAAPNCASPLVPSAFTYPQYSVVIRAQRALFTVSNDSEGIPTLWLDPDGPLGALEKQPLAEGIEDMQVAMGIDTSGDGAIQESASTPPVANDDEWTGNAAGDTWPSGANSTKIRALRITLVARTTKTITGGDASYLRPAAENHPGASSTEKDYFRRRVLKSTIEIRNLGGSP